MFLDKLLSATVLPGFSGFLCCLVNMGKTNFRNLLAMKRQQKLRFIVPDTFYHFASSGF